MFAHLSQGDRRRPLLLTNSSPGKTVRPGKTSMESYTGDEEADSVSTSVPRSSPFVIAPALSIPVQCASNKEVFCSWKREIGTRKL